MTAKKADERTDDEALRETQEVVDQLRTDFAERDKLYQRIESVIFGKEEVVIPKAYRKTAEVRRSPLPLQTVNTITAALSINQWSCQFEPTGFGDKAQENSTLRERFFEASWVRQEQEARRRIFRAFMWSLVSKGEGVLKTVERSKTAWAGYDDKSKKLLDDFETDDEYKSLDQHAKDQIYNVKTEEWKREFPYPIVSTDIPPEQFRYLKGDEGFSVATEVKQVPYFDTLAKYGQGLNTNGRVVREAAGLGRSEWHQVMSGVPTLTMIECWTWDEVVYILIGPGQVSSSSDGKLGNGTLVRRLINHGYGDPHTKTLRGPYFHALGVSTAIRTPAKAGLSVLYPYLDLYGYLDSALTIQGNAMFMFGFPAFKRLGDTSKGPGLDAYGSENKEEEAALEVEPGKILPFDIGPVQQPSAPELDKSIGLIRQLLEPALPSVVQGMADSTSSGYEFNQASHLASLAWDPIVDNASFALGERVGFESWLIANKIGEKVYVWGTKGSGRQKDSGWLGVGPDELGTVHRYKARLDPKTPSNKVLELRAHESALKLRLESPYEAMEDLGKNPDQVEKEWTLYDIKQDPAIQNLLKAKVFKYLGIIADQKAADEQAKMAAVTGQPVQPGGPGAPSGMPQDAVGQVYAPGQGMPLTPTPQGSVTGMGPPAPGTAPTSFPGQPSGLPTTPNPRGMPSPNGP